MPEDTKTAQTVTLNDLLTQCNITSQDYHRALSITTTSRSFILKRNLSDVNINNYNRSALTAWTANLDVQPILDPYGCVKYVVSYVTKDERNMGEILKAAARENTDKEVKTQMKKIGSAFLTHREVSAQEAAYRLLGLTMLSCNVKRVCVPTDLPQNRIRILKPSSQLSHLDAESDDVYMTGLVQRYAARPDSLTSMCLADFAAEYDVCYGRQQTTHVDDLQPTDDDSKNFDNIITLQNGLGKMRHRKVRAVLLTHRFSQDKEPERFYHSELMLFVPWRNEESDLYFGQDTYSEAYVLKCDEIAKIRKKFERSAEEISTAVDEFIDNGPPQSAWDAIASQQQQDIEACIREGMTQETFIDCADDDILHTTFLD